MKTAFTLALAVGVASASNLRTVAGGDIKFLRANPGATGMSSGEGDEFPPCAQTCQGKPISCDMALEWMGYEGCGEHCDQTLKDQLLSTMGCTDMVAGVPANVEGGANNYATGAATDGTMKDCGPYGLENTFTCGQSCHMKCIEEESNDSTMDASMNGEGLAANIDSDTKVQDVAAELLGDANNDADEAANIDADSKVKNVAAELLGELGR